VNQYRVAILGAGIGREHLAAYKALTARFQVKTLCDTDVKRAASIVHPTDSIAIESDWQAVLADENIDVVDVCLPPQLHFDLCMAAMAAGKHVVCEKPLVSSLHDADALIAQAKKTDRILAPVFQYRFGPALSQLQALMDADLCGKPLAATIETHWHRDASYYNNPWRGTWTGEQGGAVLGHAIHNHDLLCSVFGSVHRLSAFTTTRVNDIETEDCASVSFQMSNGAVASSSITLGAADDKTRLRFCFDRLTATSGSKPYAPADDVWEFQARGDADQAAVDACVANVGDVPVGFVGFFNELANKLDGLPHRAVSLGDGRRSLELVSAIYHAADTASVVALPLEAGHARYKSWISR